MLFDQGVFAAIAGMDPGDLQEEFGEIAFDNPTVFQRMFGIYKSMNRFIEGDVKMIQLLERSMAPQNDAQRKEAYQMVMDDPAIQALKINGNVAKMKEHQAAIEAAVKRYVVEMKLKPALAPLFEIAKGMQGSPFGYRLDFAKMQTLSPVELSQRLQGTVSKEDILKKLKFDHVPDHIQDWFIKWILQADDKRIEDFIFALSGSGALGKDAEIKIAEQGQFMFHTCFNTFDLKCEVIHTEADLVRDLTWAIDYAKAQGGFDTA